MRVCFITIISLIQAEESTLNAASKLVMEQSKQMVMDESRGILPALFSDSGHEQCLTENREKDIRIKMLEALIGGGIEKKLATFREKGNNEYHAVGYHCLAWSQIIIIIKSASSDTIYLILILIIILTEWHCRF